MAQFFGGVALVIFVILMFATIVGAIVWRKLPLLESGGEHDEVAPTVAEEPPFPHGEPKN